MSNKLLSEFASRVEGKLRDYTSSAIAINQLNAKAIETKEINLEDKQKLLKRFSNQVESSPYATLIAWGNNSGSFYGAGISVDGSLYSDFSDEENNYREPFFDYIKRKYSVKEPEVFDARTRDWYKIAVEKQRQTWGNIYPEFRGDRRALSNSYPVYDQDNKLKGVLTSSIGLYHLDDFLKTLKIGKTGQVFVAIKSGEIIATSSLNEKFVQNNPTSNPEFKRTNSNNYANRTASKFWLKKINHNLKQIDKPQLFNVYFNEEKYFIQVDPFKNKYGLDWLIVVVVPESDFMERIHANTRNTIVLSMLALAIAAGVGVITARWITKPILQVIDAAKSLATENWGQKISLERTDELGELGKSFNSMATQLEESFAELEAKNRELERLDKLKDEFLANTSHELRTPLNGIIGIAESLLDGVAGQLPTTARSNLSIITSSGRRLSNLVNDILDFSRLKNKDIKLQLKPVSVREVAQIILTLCQPLIGNKELELMNNISSNLPAVTADENRLQQILYNLVGNAIKFTERGIVELNASLVKDYLVISVQDTGIGIPEDKLDRIFQSFEQADGSIAREYGGTGLGLAITKNLVELHEGKIDVESTVGIGSKFTFMLPISQDSPEALEITESELVSRLSIADEESNNSNCLDLPGRIGELQSVSSNTKPPSTNICQILIVDDDRTNRQVLKNFLSLEGYGLKEASSGKEALALLEANFQPDLILLDIMMPEMTGFQVAKRIRDRECWSIDKLPIMFLSARNQVEDVVVGFREGANDYFTKPIIREELITRIRTHLNLQRQSRKRQQAERKLNEERKIRAKFLEAVPVGVFVTDADGQPYYANQMAQQILGKGIVDTTRKQLTETYQVYLADTECIYPEDEAPLNLALKGKKTRVDNMEIYQRGRKIPLEASATPIHNEKGEISYAIAAFQDITERKKFTRQLAEAKANLELKVAERTKELSQTVAELRKVQAQLVLENELLRNADSNSYEYQVGAALAPDAHTYVVRQADRDLYRFLQEGHYCFILNARQMGKSSLCARIINLLQTQKFACCEMDLNEFSSKNISEEKWYFDFLSILIDRLELKKQINFRAWWRERLDNSPMRRLSEFIETILLPSFPHQKITIFVDEIDKILTLGFDTDAFFTLLRSFYNRRSFNPEYNRLNFVFAGVANQFILIQDPDGTPFNIGKAITLEPFKLEEVEPLTMGLKAKYSHPQALLKEVLFWTGGQPFLTQKICQLIHDSSIVLSEGNEKIWVKNLVYEQIIDDWETKDMPEHLTSIRARILSPQSSTVQLLKLYQQILNLGGIYYKNSSLEKELLLTGLVCIKNQYLCVYNQIYEKVFNRDWIEENINLSAK